MCIHNLQGITKYYMCIQIVGTRVITKYYMCIQIHNLQGQLFIAPNFLRIEIATT